jgi:NAD(P)-dependent dehydrogenase (short-subunit alcohol dehydrogenase family)
MRLKDKVVIITGATSGIGKSLAVQVVAEGGKVLVHGIEKSDGEKIVSSLGESASLCIADLNDQDAPNKITAAAIAAFGKIDAVVNNAAIFERHKLPELTPESFARTITINLQSSLFLIKAALPYLIETQGCVLNIGSINAYSGEPSLLAYSISKAGMQTMTRNLANTYGVDKVRFNLINPGWILTDREYADQIKRGLPQGWPETLGKINIPSGVMSTPEQLATACIYWLGDESRPFTGSIVDLEQFSIIGRNPEK